MAIIEVKNRAIIKTQHRSDIYESWTLDTNEGTLFFKRFEKDRSPGYLGHYGWGIGVTPLDDKYFFIRDFTTKREGLLLTKVENIRNADGPCIVLGGWLFESGETGGYAREVKPGWFVPAYEPNQPCYYEFVFAHGTASRLKAKEFTNAIRSFVDTRFWGATGHVWWEDLEHNRNESLKIWVHFFHGVDEDAREYLQYLQLRNEPADAWAHDIVSSQVSTQASNDDIVEKLQELAELLGKGFIDEEEFKSAKSQLLNRPFATTKPWGQMSYADRIGLQIGDLVNHDMFGEGVIENLEISEYETIVSVDFFDVGQKRLDLAWAPLRKI